MSDPKATKMTLREAVEIVAEGRELYCARRTYPNNPLDRPVGNDSMELFRRAEATWDRARAIVDAAVDAHEARQALESLPMDPADTGFDWHTEPLWEAWKKADDKLRALERGEVQP